MNNAQIRDKILAYDNEQTAAINENKDKIATVEQSVTDLDSKLSKDYIIDYGSNENGSWEKWASGKLVQKSKITITTGTTESFGSLYRSNSTTTIEFPIPFIDTPELYPNNNGPGAFENIVQSLDKYSFGLRLIHVFNQKVDTPISYIAVGKWK